MRNLVRVALNVYQTALDKYRFCFMRESNSKLTPKEVALFLVLACTFLTVYGRDAARFFRTHARIQTVLSEGVRSNSVCFLVDEGKEGLKATKNRAIIGPPAKRHSYGVLLASRCWPNIEC